MSLAKENQTERKKIKNGTRFRIITFVVVILTISYLSVFIAHSTIFLPPNVTFDPESIDFGPICPGEDVVYDVTVKIRRAGRIETTGTFISTDTQNAVLRFYQQPVVRDHPVEFTYTVAWTVPDFPPGPYERLLFVTDNRSKPTIHTVYFEVKDDCQ